MIIDAKVVRSGDELTRLVDRINNSEWDEEDDPEEYTVEALQAYIDTPDTVFITCQTTNNGEYELLGIASGRVEVKPHKNFKWLYVDEVDVCCNHRKKGAGTVLMNALVAFCKENDCEELWLAAGTKNIIANKFYESLKPDDIAPCIGYTFELDD